MLQVKAIGGVLASLTEPAWEFPDCKIASVRAQASERQRSKIAAACTPSLGIQGAVMAGRYSESFAEFGGPRVAVPNSCPGIAWNPLRHCDTTWPDCARAFPLLGIKGGSAAISGVQALEGSSRRWMETSKKPPRMFLAASLHGEHDNPPADSTRSSPRGPLFPK